MSYRPWGGTDWVLSLSTEKKWHFAGVLGTEERSLCSWKNLKDMGVLASQSFLHIVDLESHKYSNASQNAFDSRFEEFRSSGGLLSDVRRFNLMDEIFVIKQIGRTLEDLGESIVLDFTSMPKRFLFPILRLLLLSSSIKNLVVTYASPDHYTDDALYEDIGTWKNLPGFGGSGETERESLVVSIGFLVESLGSHISRTPKLGAIKMLIPFPSPLNALRRTRQSISSIERDHDTARIEKYLIDSRDISSAYSKIIHLADKSQEPLAFAPFGPKPISVAMCIYAALNQSSVYYPQPTIYHPEYSKGVQNGCHSKATRAYWIKHEGVNLYQT